MAADNIQEVGARMVLQNGAKFKAQLDSYTKSLQAFNDEQERVAKLTATASDGLDDEGAAAAKATASLKAATAAAKGQADAQDAVAASATKSAEKVAAGATAMTATVKKATEASTKILKVASVGLGAVVYEGIKQYNSFQQMIAQSAIDAGIKNSQLPAFSKMALQISNSTGLAATSIADMMYRIASANPKIGMTTKSMATMATAAANLAVMAGATGDTDSIGRAYGAITSNGLSLRNGGPALGYNSAGAAAINEWMLATTGHGDMKMGDLVSALGTGILPVAQTYGLSLNDVGAALDVMSPAMGASSAATRLKTAIGMLGSPSQKTSQAMELIGGNATTLSGLLRGQGLGAALNYLGGLQNKVMSASTFVGGGIFGAASGKYSGVMGGADWLKAYGFTNPTLVALLQSKGAAGLEGLNKSQIAALGFSGGLTGQQAAKTIVSDLIGQMFGAGHTGAAIMQLVNEYGTYQNKRSALSAAENPKSYGAALRTAYAEPIVAVHRFEQQLKNLTIEVGQDVTPAFDSFLHDLEKLGSWFGANKWAIKSLLGLGAAITGGAALIKIAQGAVGLVHGATSIVRVVTNPTSAVQSIFNSGGMKGATGAVAKGGTDLQGAAAEVSKAATALSGDDAKLGLGAAGLEADDAKLGVSGGGGLLAALGLGGVAAASKRGASKLSEDLAERARVLGGDAVKGAEDADGFLDKIFSNTVGKVLEDNGGATKLGTDVGVAYGISQVEKKYMNSNPFLSDLSQRGTKSYYDSLNSEFSQYDGKLKTGADHESAAASKLDSTADKLDSAAANLNQAAANAAAALSADGTYKRANAGLMNKVART